MIEVGEWLKQNEMTPAQLADTLNIPRGQVSRLIAGEEMPDSLTLWALKGLEHRERDVETKGSGQVPESPKKALAKELADDTWTGKTARLALPILVDLAEQKRTITYSDLAKAVEARGGTNAGKLTKYSFPLGKIAKAMEREGLPALTTLVVTAADGLPSYGIDVFIADHFRLDHAEREALKDDPGFRRAKVEQLWEEVYRYQHWREKMAALGLTGDPEYDL